ncbi:PEP/pyruvate-binding domain-containing protein [Amycolatopsis sp. cmx-4-68]|uniref:PEP/pyruvate-binding domain-containing protein n=1 Tax=Amycolatopsis sp. cmx-4-68 TaxID=2790938 RepID=UPI00397C8A6F
MTTSQAVLLPLPQATDRRLAGTKAATLAALAAQGLPVPEGVVIPAGVFAQALAAAREPPAARLELPGDVLTALVEAVRPWGDVALAVRSSAVDEDLPGFSYAGQYSTVLRVRGRDALRAAVLRCWTSAFGERVVAYSGGVGEDPAMAVLVQPMVPAAAAGVAFTADPVTGERDVVVIDAVPGLAERLVSGEVTPERWTVRDGRAHREPGADAALDAGSALAVAELACAVSRLRGAPQDVEWAVADGEVVLLQARPVTALPPAPVPLPVEVPAGYWTRESSHAPLPWTRLTHAAYQSRMPAIRTAVGELGLLIEGVDLRDIGGLEYLRVLPLGGREPVRLPDWAVPLAFRLVPALRRRVRKCVAANRADVPMRHVHLWTGHWRPRLEACAATLRDIDLGLLDDDALERHAESTLKLFELGLSIHFRLHLALAMVLRELALACRELLGWDDQAWLRLVAGTSVRSTEPARALADLAAHVAARPRLRRLVEDPASDVLAEDTDFAARFTGYLRRYCCRTLSYDFSEPAIDERPDLVLALLRHQLAAGYDPQAREQELAGRRAAAAAEARAVLAGHDTAAQERFETALARALAAYPVREDNEFHTVSAPGALLRRAVLELGRRLTRRGLLGDPSAAFHLRPPELLAALRHGDDLHALAARRAGERIWALANPGPPSYGTPPPPPPPLTSLPAEARFANEAFLWLLDRVLAPSPSPSPSPSRETDSQVVRGIAASPGSYTGVVCVIRDETELGRLRAGEVLVCPMTSPVWSVVFPSVGALVTDAGGTLSHPAIIAREYAVPAVVATGDATTRLRDGQVVTVDGTTGQVRVQP